MPVTTSFKTFEQFFPENVVHYCYDLWVAHRFTFKITRERITKLGDYRFDPDHQLHAISVNNNLNQYAFLITYLHEVAHLLTYHQLGKKAVPHGKEWKENFRLLLLPVMNDLVFPEDILVPLRRYMIDPKASSHSDQNLASALSTYNSDAPGTLLSQVDIGSRFIFRERVFEKEQVKRTRVLCKEVISGRKYSISKIARVLLSE